MKFQNTNGLRSKHMKIFAEKWNLFWGSKHKGNVPRGKVWSAQAEHLTSNFLKAVFHKFHLVHY